MTIDGQRLKPWQALLALAIGAAFAGAPKPAVPLAADEAAQARQIDDEGRGGAEALVVDAVLRVTSNQVPDGAAIVKS